MLAYMVLTLQIQIPGFLLSRNPLIFLVKNYVTINDVMIQGRSRDNGGGGGGIVVVVVAMAGIVA